MEVASFFAIGTRSYDQSTKFPVTSYHNPERYRISLQCIPTISNCHQKCILFPKFHRQHGLYVAVHIIKTSFRKPPERRSTTNLKISRPDPYGESSLPVSSTPYHNADVLNTVTSAMESITLVQQRLASSLNLPAIQLDKFSGSPSEFPTFKSVCPLVSIQIKNLRKQ